MPLYGLTRIGQLWISCPFLEQPRTKKIWGLKRIQKVAFVTQQLNVTLIVLTWYQLYKKLFLCNCQNSFIFSLFTIEFFCSNLLEVLKTNSNETKLHMVKKNHDFDFLPIKLMACKKIGNFPGKLKAKFLEIRLGRYSLVFVPILCVNNRKLLLNRVHFS